MFQTLSCVLHYLRTAPQYRLSFQESGQTHIITFRFDLMLLNRNLYDEQ